MKSILLATRQALGPRFAATFTPSMIRCDLLQELRVAFWNGGIRNRLAIGLKIVPCSGERTLCCRLCTEGASDVTRFASFTGHWKASIGRRRKPKDCCADPTDCLGGASPAFRSSIAYQGQTLRLAARIDAVETNDEKLNWKLRKITQPMCKLAVKV